MESSPSRVPGPGTPWLSSQEDEPRQRRLTTMKRRASGLLALAAAVFIGASVFDERYSWLLYVRTTAEAALVGGIADWFAVTALFRHPLGIPIPHTAIIPSRKDRIGNALGTFVERNFLSRDVISARLAPVRLGERAARWLCYPANSAIVARHVAAGLSGAVRVFRDEDVQQIIDRGLASWIGSLRLGPILGELLALFTEGGRHQELLDAALDTIARLVAENEAVIRERIRAESPWWIPERIDDRIHDRIVRGIETTLQQVSTDPLHPLRVRYDESIRDFVQRLRSSAELGDRIDELKSELLRQPAVRSFSAVIWKDLKERLLRAAEARDDSASGALQRGLSTLGATLLSDPALLAKVESWMCDAVLYTVERYRDEARQLISHTVSQWDAVATSRKIELQVGSDLQFIRINGTLAGAIIGLALQVVSAWL
ncbi:MAG: DUF445 domain-containing protein [Deltaproteobacteria bacterium]|nr:DUF445 domain-containing protein [Deltaproteobacteria bacterium]